MAFIYRYQIQNKEVRKRTNLKEYEDIVIESIKKYYENRIKDCRVERNFFEYRLIYKASNDELRKVSKMILKKCPILKSEIITNNSRINGVKYFERIRQKYYAFVERDEDEKPSKFHLIDYDDFNEIDSFSEVAKKRFNEYCLRHQKKITNENIDIFSKALAIPFYMDVFTINLNNSYFFEQDIGENNLVLIEGYQREYNTGYQREKENIQKIISYLDVENLMESGETYDDENLMDGFNISKCLKIIDGEEIKKVDKAITIEFPEAGSVKNFDNKNYKNIDFSVHNVGQALATSLSEIGKPPFLFFDFGVSEGRNAFNRPTIRDIDLSEKPSIVISHVHRDHWYGLTIFTESFYCDWYIPHQYKEPLFLKRCAEILANGGSVSYIDSPIMSAFGTIFKGSKLSNYDPTRAAKQKHENGLGMKLKLFSEKVNSDVNVLIPGDQNFDYIPRSYLSDIDVLVASHHGGKYSWSTRQDVFLDIPYNYNNGQIIYSYGFNNTHSHPSSILDYEERDWVRRHDTIKDSTFKLKQDY